VRSTVDLARNLNLRVVAEGVEDERAWRRLEAMGCEVVQGFFMSQPVPAEEFDAWLEGWSAPVPHPVAPDLGLYRIPDDARR
jgi:EAL domain-containing protein (putative c-di-GMP-specific phosphodiesterase class I)